MLLERPFPVTNPEVLCCWNCCATASLCCVMIGWVVVNRNCEKIKRERKESWRWKSLFESAKKFSAWKRPTTFICHITIFQYFDTRRLQQSGHEDPGRFFSRESVKSAHFMLWTNIKLIMIVKFISFITSAMASTRTAFNEIHKIYILRHNVYHSFIAFRFHIFAYMKWIKLTSLFRLTLDLSRNQGHFIVLRSVFRKSSLNKQ